MVELLSRPWQDRLADLLASSESSLLIASPYIKRDAAQWLLDRLNAQRRDAVRTTIVTDISPDSVLGASLDIDALLLLGQALRRVTVFDVNRLHVKVYVADKRRAIVTSGNLTPSAFAANYEYGVLVTDARTARRIFTDMKKYARAGRRVEYDQLVRLNEVGREYRGKFQRTSERANAAARLELTREWDSIAAGFGVPAELREIGSARFKGLILDVLARQGPLTTKELCQVIQASAPHLCDDSLIRVARDGSRKRQWRHDVHTAQETLHKQGVLSRDAEGRWYIQRVDGGRE